MQITNVEIQIERLSASLLLCLPLISAFCTKWNHSYKTFDLLCFFFYLFQPVLTSALVYRERFPKRKKKPRNSLVQIPYTHLQKPLFSFPPKNKGNLKTVVFYQISTRPKLCYGSPARVHSVCFVTLGFYLCVSYASSPGAELA